MNIKAWIEAMRLRTLPVGCSGVIGGTACALYHGHFAVLPFLICLFFAILSQISSNFANEYYDFKNGLDKKGREGFRRGVTEGDITPLAMKRATFLTLAIACVAGCSLIIWGGWWLIFIGIAIAIFALAYSTGPFPLSHNGLGDVTVIIFFGFVPVIFTQYVISTILLFDSTTILTGAAIGLMASNVLIVNNYRDVEDDRSVGKRTTVVLLGKKTMSIVYYINGILAAIFLAMASSAMPFWISAGWLTYFAFHSMIWTKMRVSQGNELNIILKNTSLLLFFTTIYLLIIFASIRPSDAGVFEL